MLFIPLGSLKTFGLGDTPWAVILTYPTFLIPFCTWLLLGHFKTIPRETRSVRGSTERAGFRPWSASPSRSPSPVPLRGDLRLHLVLERVPRRARLVNSPQQKTIPIGVLAELVRGDVFYWGPLMAGALLGSIPVALVYSFFVEHYVTALTGAVKG